MAKKQAKSQDNLTVEVLLACDGLSTDPNKGKATIYGVFDQFTFAEFPAVANFFVYAKIAGVRGKRSLSIDLLNQNGKSILDDCPTVEVEIPDADKKGVFVVRFEGLKFKKAGKYQLVMRTNGRIVGTPYQLSAIQKKANEK